MKREADEEITMPTTRHIKRRKMITYDEEKKGDSKYKVDDELITLLGKTNVLDLLHGKKGGDIFVVHRDDSLSTVMKTLAEMNITSVPVLTKEEKFYGFIDILDCLKFLVDLLGEHVVTKADFDVYAADEFKAATVGKLMTYPYSKKNPFHPVTSSQSLISVVELMAKGLHRIPVVDDDRNLLNIITQSTVIQFLKSHMNTCGSKCTMPLKEMEFSDQYVIRIEESERAIVAFRVMKTTGVSCVAIVSELGEGGKIKGNVSAKDIKKIASTGRFVSRLYKTVGEFISNDPVVLKRNDTLEKAVETLCEHKIHHVYVVDDKQYPVGVISLTDILYELMKDTSHSAGHQ